MFTGNLSQYQLHVLPESHVKHLVRLIQHHHIHMIQLDGMPPHMVHHAPGGTHYNLCAPQPGNLPAYLLPSVNRKHLDTVHIFRDTADLVCRLHRQFPGRAQDNGLQASEFGIYLLQCRDGKCRRLSRSRLCLSYDVFPLQQIRDRLYLDGRKLLKSHLPDGTHDSFVQKRLYGRQAVRPVHIRQYTAFFCRTLIRRCLFPLQIRIFKAFQPSIQI